MAVSKENFTTTAQRHDGSGLATEITEATETDVASLFNRGLRGYQDVVYDLEICVRMTPPLSSGL